MDQALLNQLSAQLNPIYDPQRQLIQQQQAQLPGQFNLERQGLEQAKANAFRDISSKARGMGVAFGGYSPSEQARYTGATYLPAVGDIGKRQSDATTSLQQALNEIYGNQQTQAMGLYGNEMDRREKQRQFDQQLAAQREEAAASRASSYSSSGGAAVDPYKGFNASVNKNADGKVTGTSFFGPGNQPITAAQYYGATGTGWQGLMNFLKNDNDPVSKKAYSGMVGVQQGSIPLKTLTNKYPWIFGGV